MDFSDVFGGPPRRFSIQESRARYSFSEAAMDSEPEEDSAVASQSPWSVMDEKPVFGAETCNRRTHPGDDFFDDIFKGDDIESFNSPRRRSSRDFFGSSPGSRVLSPSMPLPPKAEPFSTSVPAQFSLPPKVTKTADSPSFGCTTNRSPFNNKDGISNGISNGHISSASLPRFSSQATEMQDETRYNRPMYRKSPLSLEVSNGIQESSHETKSDKNNTDIKLKTSESKEVPLHNGQFHFSIYKWAGSGVPLLMSLGGGSKSRFKDRFRTARSSSSNGRIQSDCNGRLPTLEERGISLDTESVSLKVNAWSHHDSGKENKTESGRNIEEVHLKIPEPKILVSEGKDIPQGEAVSVKNAVEESHSKHETNKNETSVNKAQTSMSEQKSLHELLNDENQEQGKSAEGKDNKVKNTNIANGDANVNTNVKKNDAKRINSDRSEVTNGGLKNSEKNSGDAFVRSRDKGKVGEFVKMFDHESSEKVKNDIGSQSTRWKQVNILGKENGVSIAVNTDEKVHMLNKTQKPVSSSREDHNFSKKKVKQESHSKISSHKASGLSSNDKNESLFSESLPNSNGTKVENRDEPLHGFFLVEELSHFEEKVSETNGESEHIQASNAKIQQWSSGRNGNIRSLLSTLQLVLWPESGWKPVPLVDLIEASAVKRAYQRALLCLHPDKLQQKGAASHQKYIAQQVFEILQEAWDHFNSLGAI